MSAAKYFLIGGFALFAGVGLLGYIKRPASPKKAETALAVEAAPKAAPTQIVQEIAIPAPKPAPKPPHSKPAPIPKPIAKPIAKPIQVPVQTIAPQVAAAQTEAKVQLDSTQLAAPSAIQKSDKPAAMEAALPSADRIRLLFATDSTKLPIVETLSFTSRVPWIQGRPAWIADYASHYNTSRHFIARSLNKKLDYLSQKVSPGDRFNVFKKDKNIQFYLVGDLSRCRVWLYYLDLDQNERVLLKSYPMGSGRPDPKKKSGYLTPAGKYTFGDKIAIYKPGTLGYYQDQQIEMIQIFGTRWIPFEQEIEGCTEPAKGFGFHGAPWVQDPETHQWKEDRSKVSKADTDGCICLHSEDIEEIFSIVITKPTTIELVKDFRDAKLPGIEKTL